MKSLLRTKWLGRQSFLFLLAACLLCACGEQKLYHVYRAVPSRGWTKADTLVFPVLVSDSGCRRALSIEVRHTNNYPYRNLNVSLTLVSPDSLPLSVPDTLHLTLANESGRWNGTGLGALYLFEQPVAEHPALPDSGLYQIKIAHCLPDSLLQGVSDVGICLK